MLALLVADDLTGACDAAVHFAARGASTRVHWKGEPVPAHVLAFTTESRALGQDEIFARMRALVPFAASSQPRILFKKIDSVLRGRTGCEIAAARAAFGCEIAVITPAFPALGRTVRNGFLHIDGESTGIHVAAKLRGDGLDECFHGSLRDGVERGCQDISVDAATDDDLHEIVAAGFNTGLRILWAGSGGLAFALADAMCGHKVVTPAPPRQSIPLLFCIGSTHDATLRQARELLARRPALELSAGNSNPAAAAAAIARGEHILLRIVRGITPTARVREIVCAARSGAIFCCGGDTASLVFEALELNSIDLQGETAPGVPWGSIDGGSMNGLSVITKSGGFGGPETLIQVADYFTCIEN